MNTLCTVVHSTLENHVLGSQHCLAAPIVYILQVFERGSIEIFLGYASLALLAGSTEATEIIIH